MVEVTAIGKQSNLFRYVQKYSCKSFTLHGPAMFMKFTLSSIFFVNAVRKETCLSVRFQILFTLVHRRIKIQQS
jgi:hypothetical protein